MLFLIRPLRPDEYPLLEEFLYEAVFQEEGQPPLPKSIVRLPELRRYIEHFGTGKGDSALCADAEGIVEGVARGCGRYTASVMWTTPCRSLPSPYLRNTAVRAWEARW